MKKKNLSVVLAGMMLASAGFTACNKVADDENTLEIRVVSLGYGHQYLEELKKKFVAANPDTNIEIVATIEQDEGVILTAGPKANTADLMLGTYPYFEEVDNGAGVVKGYDHVLEATPKIALSCIRLSFISAICVASELSPTIRYEAS